MTVQRLDSSSLFAPRIGFCSAVRAGDFVYLAGVTAIAGDGEVVGGDDPYLQARECTAKIGAALHALAARADQVVQTRVYLTDPGHWQAVGRAHREAFGQAPPAATMVVVKQLLDPRMLIEIEAVAYIGD
ncbi:MAG: Rid family hydrolase [Actinomycetota bacterium]|nr:Rid family hydrolase [Actinomycetota bacterium]